MKILLINPPFNRLKGIKEFYYPIGLGYIASSLKKAGHDVLIYNADASKKDEKTARYKNSYAMQMGTHKTYLESIDDDENIVWVEIKKVISKYNPDVLAITTSSAKFKSAVKIADIFKRMKKEGLVVVGGPHATICPDETINNKHVDIIIKGEGERTAVELFENIKERKDISGIKGISYKKEGKTIHNEDRELIENLDELPFPEKKDIAFPERYSKNMFGAIVGLRGCPFRCSFCAAQCTWSRRVRFRSADNVLDEIKYVINEFGTKEFFFWDDSFTVNRDRTMELCRKIIKEGLNISWGCSTKVTLLDEELVRLMKKAGCSSVELGVETGSEKMLKLIKKDITIPQVRRAMNLLKKYRISYTLFMMIGFPEETKEDIEQTIKFIKEAESGFICFSIFTPYPGTELYEKAKELKLIPKNIAWEHFSHQSPENAFTKYISKEEFKKYVKIMASLIDKNNSSFKRKIEYAQARLGFYMKNPNIFISRALEELRRK
ncbi:radical SAM protein [Candidatus Woesearchaeota archaeon]|nr:radical SAM protein [Candidatus Woesearchaeota archaeon]